MVRFIEVRCDISGINKKYSGEATVAMYGTKSAARYSEDTSLREIIKAECKKKINEIYFFNIIIDHDNNIFVLSKRSPHSSKYASANGAACTQINIGFDNYKMLERFIMSSMFEGYFFELNINEFIDYYITNKKIFAINSVLDSKVNIGNSLTKNLEFSYSKKENLIFTTNINHIKILIILSLLKEKKYSSLIYSNRNIESIITTYKNIKDLYLTDDEYSKIYCKVRNFITMKENIKMIKSLSITQIQDVLMHINKSIDMNLRTIEVLSNTSNNKSPFMYSITKKKSTTSQLDVTASNAAKNIDSLIKIQRKFLETLEAQIDIEKTLTIR